MALRNIREKKDPILRKKSKVVKEITKSVLTLLDDMKETMHEADGVGLAAPQVGILKRLAVIDVGDEQYGHIELINPQILSQDGTQCGKEGCLSIPGETGHVIRPSHVKVKTLNRDGEETTIEANDYLAVAICHEIDHLEGILFTDKIVEVEEDDEPEDDDNDKDKDKD